MTFEFLHTAARRWYDFSENTNPYHNWKHASDVVAAVNKMTASPSPELLLAARWHDAVYIAGAGSDANEQCSAAALINTAYPLKNTPDWDVIERAAELIRYTSVEHHLHDRGIIGDLAMLLDADLSGLACSYAEFVFKQDNIIIEQLGNIEDRCRCATFLENFLTCREFIFHTDFGRKRYEQIAKENLVRYCAEFKPSV